jgi:ribonuclease P protein component
VLGQRTIRVASGPFVAFACDAAANGPRLGLVVGKRFAPRAVDRNRIRRVVRESFRRRRADLPALDIVVQCVRTAGSEAPGTAIERLWDGLSRKCAGRST